MAVNSESVHKSDEILRVEGDVGDLQIVEELSNSEDEVELESTSNAVASIPDSFLQGNSGPAIGSVAVTNSDNVHFGNKLFFNGPVTIKQIVQSRGGIDNDSYQKTEDDTIPKSDNSTKTKPPTSPKSQIKLWHKLSLVMIAIIIVSSITAVLILTQAGHIETKHASSSDGLNSSTDLLIAPNHLRIVSRTDWLAQPVEGPIDAMKHPTPWVIITHTATEGCTTQSECVLRVRIMQTYHIESRGWSDIGYNFLIGGDGSAYYGRGWDQVGAHTKGYNHRSIAIAFIGLYNNQSPTDYQIQACQNLIKLGVEEGKIAKDYKLFAHRQLMPTLSPGDKIFEIIKTWPHFVKDSDPSKITWS